MNYFGLFFTFMVPGMIIGTMAAIGAHEAAAERRRRQRQARRATLRTMPRGKLYICTLERREADAA